MTWVDPSSSKDGVRGGGGGVRGCGGAGVGRMEGWGRVGVDIARALVFPRSQCMLNNKH